jgi:hypothetical protein
MLKTRILENKMVTVKDISPLEELRHYVKTSATLQSPEELGNFFQHTLIPDGKENESSPLEMSEPIKEPLPSLADGLSSPINIGEQNLYEKAAKTEKVMNGGELVDNVIGFESFKGMSYHGSAI